MVHDDDAIRNAYKIRPSVYIILAARDASENARVLIILSPSGIPSLYLGVPHPSGSGHSPEVQSLVLPPLVKEHIGRGILRVLVELFLVVTLSASTNAYLRHVLVIKETPVSAVMGAVVLDVSSIVTRFERT